MTTGDAALREDQAEQAPKKAAPDWELIEAQYRAGIMSLREIATAHGITHGAVNKRAKRDDWSRDLQAKIQAKADALVSKAAVSAEVSKSALVTEKLVVEVEAQVQARIRLGHRKDIGRARAVVNALMMEMELEAGPENAELLGRLGELMASPDEKGVDKLNDLYQKIISLPGRAKTMKDLVEALRPLVSMEREAYGMDAGKVGDLPIVSIKDLTGRK